MAVSERAAVVANGSLFYGFNGWAIAAVINTGFRRDRARCV